MTLDFSTETRVGAKLETRIFRNGNTYHVHGSGRYYTAAVDSLGKIGVITTKGPWTGGFKGQNILELTECHNFIAACELAQRLALGVA